MAQGAQMDGGNGGAAHAGLAPGVGAVRKVEKMGRLASDRAGSLPALAAAIRPDAPNLTFQPGAPGALPWHSPGNGYPHR
ncbi:hypothetical protein GCM10027021_06800 [Dyella kyungheensis]